MAILMPGPPVSQAVPETALFAAKGQHHRPGGPGVRERVFSFVEGKSVIVSAATAWFERWLLKGAEESGQFQGRGCVIGWE
jgi:hypothetical protein